MKRWATTTHRVSRRPHTLALGVAALLLAFPVAAAQGQQPFSREAEVTVDDEGSASAKARIAVGAGGDITLDDGRLDIEAGIGLAAELEAISDELQLGDDDMGINASASARLEAILGAEGKVHAHIDEHGITIGAQAEAGAFVSAEASVYFEAHLFGVKAEVQATAKAHAGAMIHGEAKAVIGFDGTITLTASGGAAVGVGASVGIEVTVSAQELMEELGLADLKELVAWGDQFAEDPDGVLEGIAREGQGRITREVIGSVETLIQNAAEAIGELPERITEDLLSTYLPSIWNEEETIVPDVDGSRDDWTRSGDAPWQPGRGNEYRRFRQYERWSE